MWNISMRLQKKNSSRKYTKHLLLAFALKRNFRSCADYKKIKLSLIISDQQKAVKSQNGKKKTHMTLLREPKIGLVSTRESRNIILLRMLSNNASSRQLRNSTQSSTNPALFFFFLSPRLPIQPMSIFKQLKTNRLMKNLLYKTLLETPKNPSGECEEMQWFW